MEGCVCVKSVLIGRGKPLTNYYLNPTLSKPVKLQQEEIVDTACNRLEQKTYVSKATLGNLTVKRRLYMPHTL